MTRTDLGLVLIATTLINFIYAASDMSLIAFVASVIAHACLVLVPRAFDSEAEKLRGEFSKALSIQLADIETLKNRLDAMAITRGGR